MGTEPIESEIPIEYEDLYDEVQEALQVYNMLQDNIDTMNGKYIGKNVVGIDSILSMLDVQDKQLCYKIILTLDRARSNIINKSTADANKKAPTPKA